jgi:hypothetical protein
LNRDRASRPLWAKRLTTSCANTGSTHSENASPYWPGLRISLLAERPGFLGASRQDAALPRIGGRRLSAAIRPGLKVVDRVDDSSAEIPIGRPGP